MKWLLTIAVVLSLLVAGTAQGVDVWLTGSDSDFTTRIGTEIDEGKRVEIGVEWQSRFDWVRPFQDADYLGGVYGVLILPDIGNGFVKPYLGGRILFDYEIEGWPAIGGPVAGLLVQDNIVVEYQNQRWSREIAMLNPDRHKVSVGLRFKF